MEHTTALWAVYGHFYNDDYDYYNDDDDCDNDCNLDSSSGKVVAWSSVWLMAGTTSLLGGIKFYSENDFQVAPAP